MAELKTQPSAADVDAFIAAVEDPKRRADAKDLCALMAKITRREPVLWGSSIVGFGAYTYTYASGRTGDWPLTGVSPRKQALSVYIMSGFSGSDQLLADLGPHKVGKSCLYIRDLKKIDTQVLARLIRQSVAHLRRTWPTR